jgi:3-oxoacyl-[acyl-carrier-protein] synthase II
MSRRVVVTGMGIITPVSCSVDDCFKRLVAGESGIRRLKLFDVSDYQIQIGGDIPDFDPSGCLDSKVIKRIDRFSQFAMVAALDAVRDSGIDFDKLDRLQCGVILGSGIGGLTTIEEQMTKLVLKGPDRVSPLTIPRLMLNAGGANVAIHFGLRGPNYSIATACASASNAMGDALDLIRRGACDVIITGGAEAALTRIGLAAFQNMRALSTRVDQPAAASRPFDADRDGFVFSEGAGVLVFEELEHARRRGAHIHCEVFGYGTNCDAGHLTQPDGQGLGAARTMELALRDARLNGDQIDYINAHGTGTPLGDLAETIAIKSVFGPAARTVSISSTKSQIGHTLGASGGIEAIITALALQRSTIPPTINLDTPDPQCDLDYTPNQARTRKLRYAMSNSFGFGGHNASLILGTLA